jgi:hypothetical protein
MLKNILACVALSIAAILAISLPGQCFEVSDDYPGKIPGSDNLNPLAVGHLVTGTVSFYDLHGRWPNSWSEVVAAGLIQCKLVGFGMEALDPDDGQLDAFGDIVYIAPSGTGSAQYSTLKNSITPQPDLITLNAPTIALRTAFAQSGKDSLMNAASSEARMAQILLAHNMTTSLNEYYATTGEWPQSWQAFLQSGFAPIDSNSVNPLNGQGIKGDGSANDFKFVVASNHCCVYATDADGSTPWRLQ